MTYSNGLLNATEAFLDRELEVAIVLAGFERIESNPDSSLTLSFVAAIVNYATIAMLSTPTGNTVTWRVLLLLDLLHAQKSMSSFTNAK